MGLLRRELVLGDLRTINIYRLEGSHQESRHLPRRVQQGVPRETKVPLLREKRDSGDLRITNIYPVEGDRQEVHHQYYLLNLKALRK